MKIEEFCNSLPMRWLPLVACLALLCGCPQVEPRRWFTGECGDNAMCGSGGLCIEQKCARACVTTSDCGDGLCFHERCMPIAYACNQGFCNDGNVCTVDECNGVTGACRYTQGTACELGKCVAGAECLACLAGKDCEHGFQCKGAAKCDDGDPTTVDSCEPGTGSCSH